MTYISLSAVSSKAWAGMIQRRTLPWLCRFESPQSPPSVFIKKWFSLKTLSGSPRVAALAAFFRGIRHVRLEGKCVLELWFGLVNIWTTAASQKPSHILIFWNRKHPMIPIHTETEVRTWHMLCSHLLKLSQFTFTESSDWLAPGVVSLPCCGKSHLISWRTMIEIGAMAMCVIAVECLCDLWSKSVMYGSDYNSRGQRINMALPYLTNSSNIDG